MLKLRRVVAVVDEEKGAREASLKIRAVLIAIASLPLMMACGGPTRIESGSAAPSTHTLSVVVSGGGSVRSTPAAIDCGATCTATLPDGTSLTLTATPSAGATFAGWSGACSGSGVCTLKLGSDSTVQATFTEASPPPPPTPPPPPPAPPPSPAPPPPPAPPPA